MPFLSLCGQHYQALIQERGMNGRNNGYVGTKIAIITNKERRNSPMLVEGERFSAWKNFVIGISARSRV